MKKSVSILRKVLVPVSIQRKASVDVEVQRKTVITTLLDMPVLLSAGPDGDCTNLVLTVVSDTQIDLSWVNGFTNSAAVSIERKLTTGGSFAEIFETASDATTYNNIGLTGLTEYTYRVRAVKNGYYSTYSNEENATTLSAYEAETVALLAAMSEQPTTALAVLINATFVSIKAALGGSFSKIKFMSLYGLHTEQAGLLDWFGNYTNTNINGATFQPKLGFPTTTGQYIDTNFDLNSLDEDNYCISFMPYNMASTVNYPISADASLFQINDYATSVRWYAFSAAYYNNMGGELLAANTIYTNKCSVTKYHRTYREGNFLDERYALVLTKNAGMTLNLATGVASGGGVQYAFAGEFLTDQELSDVCTAIHYFFDNVNGTF